VIGEYAVLFQTDLSREIEGQAQVRNGKVLGVGQRFQQAELDRRRFDRHEGHRHESNRKLFCLCARYV